MLTKVNKYLFSKSNTIFILAGGPHQDATGAQLIRQIKQQNPHTNFIGIGGPLMETEGMDKSYADVNKFCYKPLFPYKNFLHFHIERPYHPIMAYYHYKNRQVRDEVDKSKLFEDVLSIKPSAFITLSNDFFMTRFYNHLNNLYYKNGLVKPPCFHYDRTHINQRFEFQSFLDYAFSVIPKKSVNYQYFDFPNTVVGHEGVGRAWQYLYQNTPEFSELQSSDHLYLSPENNRAIVEKLVANQREKFRKQHGISPAQNVIYFAPGNTEKEVKFSFSNFTKGIKEFLNHDQVKSIGPENYTVIISVPEQNHSIVEKLANSANFGCQTLIVRDKYGAICASDAALCHNGQIVSECSALQLPVVIIDSLPLPQAYFTQLYNNFNNDLNIASNGETYPELMSVSCTSFRIAQELFRFTSDPRWRFYLADKMDKILYGMVPKFHQASAANSIVKGNQTFVKHTFTYTSMANKIISSAEKYSKSTQNLPSYKIPEYREEFIKGIQLAN